MPLQAHSLSTEWAVPSVMSASSEELPEHVWDRNGIVWRIVRDGGMATRADYGGIISVGINVLERDFGPITPIKRRTRAEVEKLVDETLIPMTIKAARELRMQRGEDPDAPKKSPNIDAILRERLIQSLME